MNTKRTHGQRKEKHENKPKKKVKKENNQSKIQGQLELVLQKLSQIEKIQIEMKKEQTEMKKEQTEMKKEQTEMKKEQTEMKKEQTEMKMEQTEMKEQINEKFEKVENRLIRIENGLFGGRAFETAQKCSVSLEFEQTYQRKRFQSYGHGCLVILNGKEYICTNKHLIYNQQQQLNILTSIKLANSDLKNKQITKNVKKKVNVLEFNNNFIQQQQEKFDDIVLIEFDQEQFQQEYHDKIKYYDINKKLIENEKLLLGEVIHSITFDRFENERLIYGKIVQKIQGGKYMISDNYSKKGFSGMPYFDSQQQFIGIHESTVYYPEKDYCKEMYEQLLDISFKDHKNKIKNVKKNIENNKFFDQLVQFSRSLDYSQGKTIIGISVLFDLIKKENLKKKQIFINLK